MANGFGVIVEQVGFLYLVVDGTVGCLLLLASVLSQSLAHELLVLYLGFGEGGADG